MRAIVIAPDIVPIRTHRGEAVGRSYSARRLRLMDASLRPIRTTPSRERKFVLWITGKLREFRFILILCVLSASTVLLVLCLTCLGLKPEDD
jgi:hypothetical protein